MTTTVKQQIAAILNNQDACWPSDAEALADAAKTLQDVLEGKFVATGEFTVPEPQWAPNEQGVMTCRKCGVQISMVAGGGGHG